MATRIPAIGNCVERMTHGERRLAERQEQKLDVHHLAWYAVPSAPNTWTPTLSFCTRGGVC